MNAKEEAVKYAEAAGMIKNNLLFLISIILISCNFAEKEKQKPIYFEGESKNQTDTAKYFKVKRVIDGDTFELEDGERVRLIGIDTPEKWESNKLNRDAERSQKDKSIIKALGLKATMYADSLLFEQLVRLEPDSTNQDRDRYNRLLRYAYLQDTILFNLKIIQDGYAYAYTKYPFIYLEQFLQAQREALENNRGLWGDVDFKEMEEE